MLSAHGTIEDAYAELDRLAEQAGRYKHPTRYVDQSARGDGNRLHAGPDCRCSDENREDSGLTFRRDVRGDRPVVHSVLWWLNEAEHDCISKLTVDFDLNRHWAVIGDRNIEEVDQHVSHETGRTQFQVLSKLNNRAAWGQDSNHHAYGAFVTCSRNTEGQDEPVCCRRHGRKLQRVEDRHQTQETPTVAKSKLREESPLNCSHIQPVARSVRLKGTRMKFCFNAPPAKVSTSSVAITVGGDPYRCSPRHVFDLSGSYESSERELEESLSDLSSGDRLQHRVRIGTFRTRQTRRARSRYKTRDVRTG